MPKYIFLIDESGDAGIQNIRSESSGGASPYMTLGGALVPLNQADFIREQLTELCVLFEKRTLHCKDLRHFQKIKFAKSMSKLDLTLFGLISYKKTLQGYRDAINGNPSKFYNVCARYLLECLGEYMDEHQLERHEVEIIFEQARFNYAKLRNYISVCQDNPIGKSELQLKRVKYLNNLSSQSIKTKTKEEESLLQIPDLVAHALYKCVDLSNGCYLITEPRYLSEIANRFYGDKQNKLIVGKGLKPIHHLRALKLDPEIFTFFESLTCDYRASNNKPIKT